MASVYWIRSFRLRLHLRLQVVLNADLVDQLKLRFQPVDVLFGVVQDVDQNFAADVILDRFAVGNALDHGAVCCALKLQVAFDDLFRVLADEDLAQVLQVGQAVEHQDALDQAIGMLHLADRLLVFVVPDALEPQWPYMRAWRKYWLMAVSSFLSWAFRYWMTFLSPFILGAPAKCNCGDGRTHASVQGEPRA